ncbi:hypothetical protein [Brucella oryzae]|uniref:hypothetical protein n=1 Tax=Brucella oryzae TaxID=335286 RepID=UPI0011B0C222|nr:hypothetical protein [Brucella oryzae]
MAIAKLSFNYCPAFFHKAASTTCSRGTSSRQAKTDVPCSGRLPLNFPFMPPYPEKGEFHKGIKISEAQIAFDLKHVTILSNIVACSLPIHE